jgi:hypothetical protein
METAKLLIDGKEPVFHCVMDSKKFGLTKEEADFQGMPEEYAIIAEPKANAGISVYAKYHSNAGWKIDTSFKTRFLVMELLGNIKNSPNYFTLLSEWSYWKIRCLLAEKCLNESPCDPDIAKAQIEANNAYVKFLAENGQKELETIYNFGQNK